MPADRCRLKTLIAHKGGHAAGFLFAKDSSFLDYKWSSLRTECDQLQVKEKRCQCLNFQGCFSLQNTGIDMTDEEVCFSFMSTNKLLSNEWDILGSSQRTPVLKSDCLFLYLSLFLSLYEYQYYFPVGGKWYWLVAKLLERRLFSWLKELFSILSLNQCVRKCVCAWVCICACVRLCCVCVPERHPAGAYVQMCVSFLMRSRACWSLLHHSAMWEKVHVMQANTASLQQDGKSVIKP